MKKIAVAIGVFVILGLVVFGAGCVGSDAVVGTYSSSVAGIASMTVTLNADGTGTISAGSALLPISGTTDLTWKALGNSNYQLNASAVSSQWTLSPDKNILSTTLQGQTVMLNRIK